MLKALGSGLVGAVALTLIHETGRRMRDDAPRLDVLGMRAIAKSLQAADVEQPDMELRDLALAGDLVSNSFYYSLIGLGKREDAWLCGAALGLAAGLGAVTLPGPLGLGPQPTERAPTTQLMTVAWYLAGGLAAAAAYRAFTVDGED
jgi:hypothetical protein